MGTSASIGWSGKGRERDWHLPGNLRSEGVNHVFEEKGVPGKSESGGPEMSMRLARLKNVREASMAGPWAGQRGGKWDWRGTQGLLGLTGQGLDFLLNMIEPLDGWKQGHDLIYSFEVLWLLRGKIGGRGVAVEWSRQAKHRIEVLEVWEVLEFRVCFERRTTNFCSCTY